MDLRQLAQTLPAIEPRGAGACHALCQGMGYQFLTCPETGRLELIESDVTSFGRLIVDCSGFYTACPGGCPRTCAAMLDRGDRDHVSDDLPSDAEDTAQTSPPTLAR